jgi:hypothetical protein
VGKVVLIAHHNRCCLIYPADILKPFELENLNPPKSPISHMVVDVIWGDSTGKESKNILCNSFKLNLSEAMIHVAPLVDELTHPVEDEGE